MFFILTYEEQNCAYVSRYVRAELRLVRYHGMVVMRFQTEEQCLKIGSVIACSKSLMETILKNNV